jgi:hypothetical protein
MSVAYYPAFLTNLRPGRSELEVDHLLHDHDAAEHPEPSNQQQKIADRSVEQRHDVIG